jgi:hypothetical protein
MLFEIVREFDLEYHLVEYVGAQVRIFDIRTEAYVFLHDVSVNPIALKVQEGFLCAGNMRIDDRMFRIRLQLHNPRHAVTIEQSGTNLLLTAHKQYLLFPRIYRFPLATCPVKFVMRDSALLLLCPHTHTPTPQVFSSVLKVGRQLLQRKNT